MTDGVLRVAQLNVGSLFEPEWDKRRHEIVAWIQHLAPDVICFEEVQESSAQPNVAGWIADELGDPWRWCYGGHAVPERSWPDTTVRMGSAVLSRWPIDSHTLHRLPMADKAGPMATGMPWELLHARTAGLDVFATHLAAAPQDGNHRQVQVVAIDQLVRDARQGLDDVMSPTRSTMPPILCGDFNAEPDSDEIRFLSSLTMLEGRTTFYQDAWRMAGDGTPGYTSDWRDNFISAQLNIHRKRIDYIFVGDPFLRSGNGGRIVHAELAFHQPRTGIVASDHRGVVADIVWPDRPA